jgi:DNA-binding transcriptional LysR family regulator
LLEQRAGMKFPREVFGFRSDSDLAQLTALRSGFGIGPCQLGIARGDRNLVPVLHAELMVPMEVWLAMHRDLRGNHRIQLMFDHLASELTGYANGSRHDE